MSAPGCKLCGKPLAYAGAVFCGAACCAEWEGGRRPADTDEASAAELFRFIGVPFTDEAKRCMAKYTDGVRRRASLLFVPNATYRGATVIERLTVKP